MRNTMPKRGGDMGWLSRVVCVAVAVSLLGGCRSEKSPEPQGAAENGSLRTAPTAQVTPRVSRGEDTTSATQAAAGESTIPASQPAPVNQPSTATLLARVTRNALADSLSSYLRSQSTSPVAWQPWGADVFEIAEKLNRPVLLSIGVSWSDLVRSHDETVFGSSEVAALISEHFIAVKVDADERPEIAERYLSAHQLIHPENGEWPVIAFLLEDGRPFESVSAAPSAAATDPATFAAILRQVVDLYSNKRETLVQQANRIEKALAAQAPDPARVRPLDAQLAAEVCARIRENLGVKQTGETYSRPKPWAILALLHAVSDGLDGPETTKPAASNESNLSVATKLLTNYYRSSLRDPVLGGFFTGALDADFREPMTAKLLPDQAAMLRAFSTAYAATGRRVFRDAGLEILRYMRDSLEREGGGFYSAQEAEPRGQASSYYTWSAAEIRQVVGPGRDVDVFMKYFNVVTDPPTQRCFLRPSRSLESVANEFKITYDEAQQALDRVRAKLREARLAQETFPRFNKSIVTSWNALAVSAYLDAYRFLGDEKAREFALLTMDWILDKLISETEGAAHYYAREKRELYGLLEDQVAVAQALLDCFRVSGKHEYLETAESIMTFIEANYADEQTGLYRDQPKTAAAEGLLRIPRYYVFDTRIPSPNAQSAMIWLQLSWLTGKKEYMDRAQRLIRAVAGQENFWGDNSSQYAEALLLAVYGAPKVVVVGKEDDAALAQLRDAAMKAFRVGSVIETLSPEKAQQTDYLPARDLKPVAYVCTPESCAPPVQDPKKLKPLVESFGKSLRVPAEKRTSSVPSERP